MRTKEDAFIFPPAVCALGAFTPNKCPVLYEKWCRGCNLVFCRAHVDPVIHNCKVKPEIVPLVIPETPKKERIVLTKKAIVNGGVIWITRMAVSELASKVSRTEKEGARLLELNTLLVDLEKVAYHESQGKKTPKAKVDEMHKTAMRLFGAEPESEKDPLFDKSK